MNVHTSISPAEFTRQVTALVAANDRRTRRAELRRRLRGYLTRAARRASLGWSVLVLVALVLWLVPMSTRAA